MLGCLVTDVQVQRETRYLLVFSLFERPLPQTSLLGRKSKRRPQLQRLHSYLPRKDYEVTTAIIDALYIQSQILRIFFVPNTLA